MSKSYLHLCSYKHITERDTSCLDSDRDKHSSYSFTHLTIVPQRALFHRTRPKQHRLLCVTVDRCHTCCLPPACGGVFGMPELAPRVQAFARCASWTTCCRAAPAAGASRSTTSAPRPGWTWTLNLTLTRSRAAARGAPAASSSSGPGGCARPIPCTCAPPRRSSGSTRLSYVRNCTCCAWPAC